MIFQDSYITEAGTALFARVTAGNGHIVWTGAATSGLNTDSYTDEQMCEITTATFGNLTSTGCATSTIMDSSHNTVHVQCEMSNADASGYARTFGIWAKIEGDAEDVLAIVARCGSGVTPIYINAFSQGRIALFVDFSVEIDNHQSQSVSVLESYYATAQALAATNRIVERMSPVEFRRFKTLSQALGNVEDGEVFCVQPKPLGETVQIQGLVSAITNEVCKAGVLCVGYNYILVLIEPYVSSQDPHPYDHYWIAAYKADELFQGNTTPAKLFTFTNMTEYPIVKDIVKLMVTPANEEHIFILDCSESKDYWDPDHPTQSARTFTLRGIDTDLIIELEHDMAMLQLDWTPCGLFGMYCYPALATDGSVITDAYLKKVMSVSNTGTLVTRYVSQSVSVYPAYSMQLDADMLRQIKPFKVQGIVFDGMEIVTVYDILSVDESPFDSNSVMIAWIDNIEAQNCTASHLNITNFKLVPCANRLLFNAGLFDGALDYTFYEAYYLTTLEQCYGLSNVDLTTVCGIDCKGVVVVDNVENVLCRKSLDDYSRRERAYNSLSGWECFCFGFGTGYYDRSTDTMTLRTPSGDFTKMLCAGGKIYPYMLRV